MLPRQDQGRQYAFCEGTLQLGQDGFVDAKLLEMSHVKMYATEPFFKIHWMFLSHLTSLLMVVPRTFSFIKRLVFPERVAAGERVGN